MIEITFKPDTLELEIKGHANYGKKGEDIVCSAISTLFYTLGKVLSDSRNMLEREHIFMDDNGNGYISCKPKKEFMGNITRSYHAVLTGLEMVALSYKDYVKFSVLLA